MEDDLERYGDIERTKMRPLASGEIKPIQALTFLGTQLSLGLGILTQLNWYSYVTAFPFSPALWLSRYRNGEEADRFLGRSIS